ncbi:MAG: IPExxxVDY family protein [Acidimicrobiia bacterium]|nr:IPExxxVDY family protein [Acidimicrobiia bacterium]
MSSVSTYRLSEDLCTEEFVLIALHSSLEDHALVYALNRNLRTKLNRTREDLEITGKCTFPVFEWKDQINDRYWMLMANNFSQEEDLQRPDLFQHEKSLTVRHLVPEHRDVDYFLKIEQGDECLEEDVVKIILQIPNIVTAYLVDTEQLKSKHNLIF